VNEVKKPEEEPKNDEKSRLFFHDLINQTHGILLFLGQKHSLDQSEIESLRAEVKLLQSLVQDHFCFEHKNLDSSKNSQTPFLKIKSSLDKLLALYYPDGSPEIEIMIGGEVCGNVDFVPLYRILNNVVKNMAEAKVSKAHFNIDFTKTGITISTQNPIVDKITRTDSKGLGLLSIASIASEMGGFFQYEIHEAIWINNVFLPYKTSITIKKIAA
jgi:hypothetical protein